MSDPLFRQYKKKSFMDNYSRLKKSIASRASAVAYDKGAFSRDSEAFPRNEFTDRGYRRWDGHTAQKQLENDVKHGIFQGIAPQEIHRRQDRLYHEFPLEVFRKHIYQEERKQREAKAWQDQRNKQGRKDHEQGKEQERRVTNS